MHPRPTLLVALTLAILLPAQKPPQPPAKFDPAKLEKEDKELATRCAGILMRFADMAKANKIGPRAKEAYDLILSQYDPNHSGARQALGFKKVKTEWVEPTKPLPWKDKGNDELRFKVIAEWTSAARQLATAHRERGLKLVAENSDNPALGVYHLRRAVYYNPFDKEANLALGHEEWKSPEGKVWYGTAEDIAFMQKMREVETTALTIARKPFEVQAVAELPEELKALDLEMHGARSANFLVFTRGTQENADNIAKWGERALDFLEYLLGPERMKKQRVRERQKQVLFTAYVWTDTERKSFIEKNPQLFESASARERAKTFANFQWLKNGRICDLGRELTPAGMHDSMVAHVYQLAFEGTNDALAEGLMHSGGWYLLSTCMTRFGALPDRSETASGPELELPGSTNWWLREMRDQAQGSTDFPINSVPRVKLSKFPNDARMKSWSFMTWLVARHPTKWFDFLAQTPADKQPFPEEIDKLGEKLFGKPLADVEADWREWAAGRGACAAATGYGPPLLPEKPNAHEIAGLKRVNELRAIAKLEGCEIDAESSMACEAHAHFLNLHGEAFRKWPEAHEEDPALEGFTPRGMRAGLNSVIVFGETDAADSIDGWVGTFYHRLPLLEPNTRRIGIAVEGDIIVLDMGSLQDPYDPDKSPKWITWPVKDQKNVPVHFFGNEFPNPVEEAAPKDKQRNPDLGYPVSIQFSRGIATNITDASLILYEAKRGAPAYNEQSREPPGSKKGEERFYVEVPCYLHTPITPMLKRMEIKDCICALPKEHLKPSTNYVVFARIKNGDGANEVVSWKFTTGSF